METEVEKVSTVDIGKSRRLHITRAMITESGQTPGCFVCMGVQKAHDENCRKRFERIYLHTAAVPTFATSVREGTSAPEAPVETSAEGDTIAESINTEEEKPKDDDDKPSETRNTKRTAPVEATTKMS